MDEYTTYGSFLIENCFIGGGDLLNVFNLNTNELLYQIEETDSGVYLYREKDKKSKRFNYDKLTKLIDGAYRIVQKEANKELERIIDVLD